MMTVQNMDSFEPGGCDKLTKVLRHHFENRSSETDNILYVGFKLAKTVAKAENNKGNHICTICHVGILLTTKKIRIFSWFHKKWFGIAHLRYFKKHSPERRGHKVAD